MKEGGSRSHPPKGARFRETGARLRVLSNSVKAWLIAYHECVTVRILCVAHCVEILEIQTIARFKSGRPHQPTHTHKIMSSNYDARTKRTTHTKTTTVQTTTAEG